MPDSLPHTPGARRRVLVVAPHFAPVNAPDGQRVRQALRHLAACGWDAEVLCIDPADVEAPTDPLLAATLPADLPVWRERALPLRLTRRLGLRTLGWRAYPVLRRRGMQLLKERTFDLVFFSTTQWPVLLAGPAWKRHFGIPYVVDIQDPWCTDFYERPGAPRPPGGWKYQVARLLAKALERRCFSGAAGFVSVSDAYLEDLGRRHAWFRARVSATIPFGADQAEFSEAERLPPPYFVCREPDRVHLVYVGAAGPIMRPALGFLFESLRRALDDFPALSTRLRLHFIGTSYAPGGVAEPYVRNLAQALGVGALVSERTSRIGYFEALRTLAAADCLLILGSSDRAYSPSKLANTLFAGRPVLALLPADSAAQGALCAAEGVSCFDPGEQAGMPRLAAVLKGLGKAAERACTPSDAVTERHGAAALARRLADVFDRVLHPAQAPKASHHGTS